MIDGIRPPISYLVYLNALTSGPVYLRSFSRHFLNYKIHPLPLDTVCLLLAFRFYGLTNRLRLVDPTRLVPAFSTSMQGASKDVSSSRRRQLPLLVKGSSLGKFSERWEHVRSEREAGKAFAATVSAEKVSGGTGSARKRRGAGDYDSESRRYAGEKANARKRLARVHGL
jgi:hypothetical protein